MSDSVLASLEDYGFNVDQKTSKDKNGSSDKKITVLKVLVCILCSLLLVEAVLYTLVIPCLTPAKLKFQGVKSLSVKQMATMLDSMNARTWMQFDTNHAVSILSTIPGIKDVSVDKHFPDRVNISIKEREPVAKTIVNIDNRSMPVQIDENGVLFPTLVSTVITDNTVPLISGLPVDNIENCMRIPEKYRTLMEQVALIRSLPQKYFAAISEIQVVPKEYGNYELVLYPIDSRIKVLTDRSLNEDALKYMMVALDVVNSIEPDVSVVDLRYGSVSYTRW